MSAAVAAAIAIAAALVAIKVWIVVAVCSSQRRGLYHRYYQEWRRLPLANVCSIWMIRRPIIQLVRVLWVVVVVLVNVRRWHLHQVIRNYPPPPAAVAAAAVVVAARPQVQAAIVMNWHHCLEKNHPTISLAVVPRNLVTWYCPWRNIVVCQSVK